MIDCRIRAELEEQIARAYSDADADGVSTEAMQKARAKVNHLLKQKHAHCVKHGCLRDSASREEG
jgi:hypothetical protein